MTLAESLQAEAVGLTLVVKINGIALQPQNPESPSGIPGCSGYHLENSYSDQPGFKMPVCDLIVNYVPDWIVDGMPMTVDVGYDTFTVRRFTGTVQNIQHGIGIHTITGHGTGWLLQRQLDAPDLDVSGLTVDQAITARLHYVGLTNISVNVSSFELGSVVAAEIAAGQTLDQVSELLDPFEGQIHEKGNGQIVALGEQYFLPSATAFKTFKTGSAQWLGDPYVASANQVVRIVDGSDHEDPNYFRDHIIATGADAPNGDPEDPDTTFEPMTAEVTNFGAGIRMPPAPTGVYSTQEFSFPLIDTQTELNNAANRKMQKYRRVPRLLLTDQVGDPTLEIGQTLQYEIPEMRVTGNWFVFGIVEEVRMGEGGGYRMNLDLRGGSRYGGTVAVSPTASYIYSSVLQAVGDTVVQIVTADASGSSPGDGEIVSYDWSGIATGSGVRFVFTFDPVTDPAPDLTLTVENTAGAQANQTQSINSDPENAGATPIVQPAVFYTADTSLGATPDGGLTWLDQASGGQGVDCKPANGVDTGIAVHGVGETLVRTTDYDNSISVVYAGGSGTITYIWWDKNVPTNCWASTATGAILRSTNDGASFSVFRGPTGYPVNAIATPLGAQSVWVFGGRGDQPTTLIQYNIIGSGTWVSIPFGGECDLTGASSALTIQAAAARVGGELMIGFKGAVHPAGTNVFHTNTVFVGTGWFKAVGLDGKQEVRFVVPDFGPNVFHVGFDEESVWNTDDAINFVEQTAVFPAGYTPNQCLWEGDFLGGLDGVFLTAVENAAGEGGIMKNIVGFLGASDWFRPIAGISTWPEPAKCKSIAIGVGGPVAAGGKLAVIYSSGELYTYDGSSNWALLSSTGVTGSNQQLGRHANGHWFVLDGQSATGNLWHSADGVTWAQVLSASGGRGVCGYAFSADGSVYAIMNGSNGNSTQAAHSLQVWKALASDLTSFSMIYEDPGWTGIFTDSATLSLFGGPRVGPLCCDQSNANNIVILCTGSSTQPDSIYSNNAGATFNTRTSPSIPRGGGALGYHAQFLASGRLGLAFDAGTNEFSRTDDLAASFSGVSLGASVNPRLMAPYHTSHFNRVVLALQTNTVEIKIVGSRNNGLTWEDIVTDIADLNVALEYDAVNDVIYYMLDGTGGIFKIEGAFDGAKTITDITFNLAGKSAGNIAQPNTLALPR